MGPREPLPTYDELLMGSILCMSFADSCSCCEVMSQSVAVLDTTLPFWICSDLAVLKRVAGHYLSQGIHVMAIRRSAVHVVLLCKLSQDALLSGRCVLAPRWLDLLRGGIPASPPSNYARDTLILGIPCMSLHVDPTHLGHLRQQMGGHHSSSPQGDEKMELAFFSPCYPF